MWLCLAVHISVYIHCDCQKMYRINMHRAYIHIIYECVYVQMCPIHMYTAIGHSGTLEL